MNECTCYEPREVQYDTGPLGEAQSRKTRLSLSTVILGT